MNYFRQIYYEMRHQVMMTWVSISGTALAIFLVMAFIMADQIHTVEIAPESNRGRVLEATGVHLHSKDGDRDSSGWGFSYKFAQKIYEGLDGVEVVGYNNAWESNCDVNVKGEEILTMMPKSTDSKFWKIYDFTFIDGRPYDEAEVAADAKLVVLSRSAARVLFGEEKVSGREIEVDAYPYKVVGVVEDVNPLLPSTYANFYKVFNPVTSGSQEDFFGDVVVNLLIKPGVDPAYIKSQVEARYKRAASDADKQDMDLIYHGQPYTSEEVGSGNYGSNNGPDLESSRRMDYIIYAILILLPAINLSSMTRGRLRHRISEIGVRRAFGAKRSSIIAQLFGENLIITLIGGLLGLVISILFMLFVFHLFFNFSGIFGASSLDAANARPDVDMLFTWKNFLWALVLCFILNTLSATLPAWRASKVEPAEALSAAR